MELGTIKYGKDIGKNASHQKYQYTQCPTCKGKRWAAVKKGVVGKLCAVCNGRRNGKVNSKKWGK